MKRNVLMGIMAVTMSFMNMSHADFTFHSNDPNACEYVAGHWSGTGKAHNWLLGDCVYYGLGTASILDNAGNFIMEVTADKDSGSFLCPNHSSKRLSGVCVNGVVTVMTQYGNLAGNFLSNSGEASGTLSVASGMSADVMIQFLRVG